MENLESVLRDAGRQRRRVRIKFTGESGREYEREMEPYAITDDGHLVAFSYFRDEFRTMPLREIEDIEVTPRTFEPRRRVEL